MVIENVGGGGGSIGASRILGVMQREGQALLSEGIAESASDIDAVMLTGYGFPRHRGGMRQILQCPENISKRDEVGALVSNRSIIHRGVDESDSKFAGFGGLASIGEFGATFMVLV